MSIKITQPFSFEAQRPNFERDIINSSSFASGNPLVLTQNEINDLIGKYGPGHLVFDTNTEKYYSTRIDQTGLFSFVEVDTTMSGIAHSETLGDIAAKEAVMPGFALSNGQVIILYLSTSSTVANATLNVNGTGAKQILIGGSATTATNLKSGYWLCEYVEDTQNNTSNWNCLKLTATSTREGFVKLGSDDVQQVLTVPATSVLNRTYPVQVNGDDQAVVNVPWKDVPREEHKLIYYTPDDPSGAAFDGLTAQQFMYEDGVVVDDDSDLDLCMHSWEEVDFSMQDVAENYVTELISCNPYKGNSTASNSILTNTGLLAGAVSNSSNEYWGYDSTKDYITAKFNDDWGGRTAILYNPNNTDEYFIHDALYGFSESNGGNDAIGLTFITFGSEVFTDGEIQTYGNVSVNESRYVKFTKLDLDLGCRQGRSFTLGLSQYKRKEDSVINGTPTSDFENGYRSNAYWRNDSPDRNGVPTNLSQPYHSFIPAAIDGCGLVAGGNTGVLPASTSMLINKDVNNVTIDGKGGTEGFIRCITQRMNNIYKFSLSRPNQFTWNSNYKQEFANGQHPEFNIVCEIVINLDNYSITYKKYTDTDYTVVSIPVEKRVLFDEMKNNNVYYGFYQASTPKGAIYNISYIVGSENSNLILDIANDVVYYLGADYQWHTMANTTPLDIMSGSHMNWNHITHKLWYSNGNEIYQIFGGIYDDIISAQVQADWDASDPADPAYIWNKPTIPDPQVQADWDASDSDDPAFILNKPVIPDPQVQADWEESDSSEMSFIQNMPGVFRDPWNNIEGFTTNVPDGTVIEHVVQDIDGNWYNGVVMNNQIWLKENLRVTHNPSGTAITYRHANNNSSNDEIYGLLYDWTTMMNGESSSNLAQSGVQGIAPDGWHIPSNTEWDNFLTYVGQQNQYILDNNNNYIAKAISSKEGWSVSTVNNSPGKNPEDNNLTNFSIYPAGNFFDTGHAIFGEHAILWSSTESDNTFGGCYDVYGKTSYVTFNDTSSNAKKTSFNSVRCVCNQSVSEWLLENGSRLYLKLTPTGMIWKQLSSIVESGDYNDLTNIPVIPTQVQADWDASDSDDPAFILNKPTIPELVNADWDASDSDDPAFILNKPDLADVATSGDYNDLINTPTIPTVPTIRTMNHEQLTDAGLDNINIHDGYYFPNAVKDADDNWYGAVVIGDQVWMAENLRSTKYLDGVELEKNMGLSNADSYFYPIDNSNLEKGNFYNWYGAMNGQSSTDSTPSGVQGIAPAGWHIPSKPEFEILIKYVSSQKRHTFNNNNSMIAKSLASTSDWTYSQQPLQGWPSVDMEDNNSTGFDAIPTGYIFDSVIEKENTTSFWTTSTSDDPNLICCFVIDGENAGVDITDITENTALCAVRCLSNLNPVQFRDWYVNTYGTMQHHLGGTLNTTATTSQTPQYSESLNGNVTLHKVAKTGSYNDLLDKPTIPAAQVQSNWNETNTASPAYIQNKPDISASLYEEIEYSDLVDLISHSQLVKGKMYRIIDYATTTVQQNTFPAKNDFDLVVTAISVNELDCRASALPRKNDTYYYTAKADLTKWLVLYDIENDTSKYAWADEHNGKGVIYRLVDENGNDCPYDFKNILFSNANNYDKVYTFNYIDGNNDNRDLSLRKPVCHNNVIKPYLIGNQISLNFNVFLNSSVGSLCSDNKIGSDSHDNNFNDSNSDIVIGDCCSYNTFGGNTTNVHFKDRCENNRLGNYCNKVFFGENCSSNGLSGYSQNIEFGISCQNIVLSSQYNNNIRIGNNNNHIRLYNNTSPSSSNWLENVYIVQGFHTSGQSYVDITTIDRGLAYRTTVGRKSDGTVKIYNEEDCIADYALMAAKVEHQLHIGPHDYDGSAEVTVDVFEDSDYYFASDFGYISGLFVCNILTMTYNNGTNIVTLDHTPAEIGNALESGKLPIIIDSQGGVGIVGIYYFMDLRHGTSNNVDYVFKRFCSDNYSFAISTLKYDDSNQYWVETKDAIAEPYSRIHTDNNNFYNQIDVSEISGNYSTFRTKKVVCTNNSSSALVLQITGFQTSTNTIYVRNSNDLTVSSGQTKMITLTYIENKGLFVESYVPTTVQALGD